MSMLIRILNLWMGMKVMTSLTLMQRVTMMEMTVDKKRQMGVHRSFLQWDFVGFSCECPYLAQTLGVNGGEFPHSQVESHPRSNHQYAGCPLLRSGNDFPCAI